MDKFSCIFWSIFILSVSSCTAVDAVYRGEEPMISVKMKDDCQ